jgi:hypothetical protein
MTFYTTNEDANDEIINRPHLKTGETRCQCGDTPCYFDNITNSIYPDKVIICNTCYLECANFERI